MDGNDIKKAWDQFWKDMTTGDGSMTIDNNGNKLDPLRVVRETIGDE